MKDILRAGGQPRQGRTFLGLGLLLIGLAYVGVLRFEFVYDDISQIVQNPILHSWRYLPRYFGEHNSASLLPNSLGNFYRPLMLTWKLAAYSVFGAHPLYWHLINLLLHIGVVSLVYLLAKRLMKDELSAALAALIFGLHPANVEVVAWVSGATDAMLAFLLLASFLLYLRSTEADSRRPLKKYLLFSSSVLVYCLATLTKEAAVVLPCIILIYEFWFLTPGQTTGRAIGQSIMSEKAARVWRVLRRTAPYSVATIAYLVLRYHVLHGLTHSNPNVSIFTEVLTAPRVICFYTWHLIVPTGLSPFYGVPYETSPSISGFFAPLIVVTAIFGGLFLAAKESRPVALASMWLLLPLLPVLNFKVLQPDDFVHDRYLYLPSIGFSMIAALGLKSLVQRIYSLIDSKALDPSKISVLNRLFAILLIGALGALTASQSRIWENELALYRWAAPIAPDNITLRNNLARALEKDGRYAEAVNILSDIYDRHPDAWIAAYDLGILYEHLGQPEESRRLYDRAIEINPSDARAIFRKAVLSLDDGKVDEAESLVRRAIELSPGEARFHELLGVALERQARYQDALEEFKLESANHPEETGVLALLQEAQGHLKTASKEPASTSP